MSVKEILDRERGNLIMLILALLTGLVLDRYDFLNLKEGVGLNFAFAFYVLVMYSILILMSVVFEKVAVQNRIKIVPSSGYYKENFTKPFKGENWYGYLDVEIPQSWTITDCYVTLEKVVPVYYEDHVLIDEEISQWYSDITRPEYKMLHWRSPSRYHDGTKINIGENSNKETFSVGKIVTGTIVDTNGISVDIKTFEFDVQKFNPNAIDFKPCGLYKFCIKFHCKRNGREIMNKKVDGYIYSEAKGGKRKIKVGVGDHNNDNDIPKPQLQKVAEESGQPESKE